MEKGAATLGEEYIIYLHSLACTDTYRDNTPAHFQNDILPLTLPLSREYEVALHSIYMPKRIYTLPKQDEESFIELYGERDGIRELITTFKISESILSEQITEILEDLNREWNVAMQELFGADTSFYFGSHESLFHQDKYLTRVALRVRYVTRGRDYSNLSLVFRPRMAAVLGFKAWTRYDIFITGQDSTEKLNPAPFFHSNYDVNYLHIYTDLVQPTRFARQSVNILATFPYANNNNYFSVSRPLYKKISNKNISSISLLMLDQFGRRIYFEETAPVTVVLHIRPFLQSVNQ